MAYLRKKTHKRGNKKYTYWYVVENIRIKGHQTPIQKYIKYLGKDIRIRKEKKHIPKYEREFNKKKTIQCKIKMLLHKSKDLLYCIKSLFEE